MKKLLSIIALIVACNVQAYAAQTSTVDVSGLSEQQVAELKKSVIDANLHKDTPVNISATVRQEATAWGEMGANMGKAMVGAAKEMGVAANDFSQTSLGKVTVGIVVYKIIGRDILKIVIGIFILVFGLSLAMYLLMSNRWGEAKYEIKPILFGLMNKKYIVSYEELEDARVARTLSTAAVLILTVTISLNCIF